jgi:hypothetical protein
MKNTTRLSILILIIILLTLNFAPVAQAMTSLQSAEGVIVVIKQNAMININGIDYLISKENSAYTQFKNRHVRVYNIHMGYRNGRLIIDFTGFRFIDAFA